MQKRGGGILDINLKDKTDLLPNYFQLHATFETKDSMGANFINSCLEQFAKTLKEDVLKGYKVGADDYLNKPFDSEVLLMKIFLLIAMKIIYYKNCY